MLYYEYIREEFLRSVSVKMKYLSQNTTDYFSEEMLASNLTFVRSLLEEYKGNILRENLTTLNPTGDNDSDRSLIKLHGSFMILAWFFFASNGIFIARHAKDMFPRWICSNGIFSIGNDVWYGVHLTCMIATWFLSIVSVIFMFIGHGFDCLKKDKILENPHSLIGIISVLLTFFQPLIAYFKPQETSSNRKWFNLLHSFVGIFLHGAVFVCHDICNMVGYCQIRQFIKNGNLCVHGISIWLRSDYKNH